jgi:hypothetical protein
MGRRRPPPAKPPRPLRRIFATQEQIDEAVRQRDQLFAHHIKPSLTPAILRQWERVRAAGATWEADQLQTFFEECCKAFGRLVAVDLFEFILAIDQTKYLPPKPRGRDAVDPGRDDRIEATFDRGNPNSVASQAWNGKLVIRNGKLQLADPEKPGPRITQAKLAECIYEGFGFSNPRLLWGRLKELRKTSHRGKSRRHFPV